MGVKSCAVREVRAHCVRPRHILRSTAALNNFQQACHSEVSLMIHSLVSQQHGFTDKIRVAGIAFISALLATTVLGAQRSRTRPEVYSSMTYIEEAGDVVGTEVLVLRTTNGVCVSYQDAEGQPGPMRIIRGEIRGDSLLFRIPPDSGYTSSTHKPVEVRPARWFRGRTSVRGLRARIDGETESILLPHKQHPYFRDSSHALLKESVRHPSSC